MLYELYVWTTKLFILSVLVVITLNMK